MKSFKEPEKPKSNEAKKRSILKSKPVEPPGPAPKKQKKGEYILYFIIDSLTAP